MSSLRRNVSRGVRWSVADQVAQQVIRITLNALLFRLTSPRDYGLIAAAFVFTSMSSFITDVGMSTALVQRPLVERRHVRTAATTTLVVGLLMAALVSGFSPAISQWLNEPRLVPVLILCSLNFPLKGLSSIPRGLLQRHFRLDDLAIANVVAALVSGVAAVVVAADGGGVWSLVVYSVGESLVLLTVATGLAVRAKVYRPGFGFSRSAFRDIAGFGANVTGAKLAYYVQINADNVLVMKFLGATALGLYSLAYRIMLLPIQKLGEVATNVALPAFSQLQGEPARLRAAFRRGLVAVVMACLPLSVGACVTAPVLVPVVFGPKAAGAILPLQILALSGPRLATTRLNGVVFQAAGRPSWDFRLQVVATVFFVAGFLVGVQHGIVGVAIAYTIVGYLVAVPQYLLVARTIGMGVLRMLAPLVPHLVAALVMAAVVEAVRRAMVPEPSLRGLLLLVTVGAVCYVSTLMVLARQQMVQLRADLLTR